MFAGLSPHSFAKKIEVSNPCTSKSSIFEQDVHRIFMGCSWDLQTYITQYNIIYIYIHNIILYIYIYIYIYIHMYIYIWATVNIWYIAPSHQFLKSVLSFYRFWYISKCYRFLKSVCHRFPSPSSISMFFQISRILLSLNLNFGCSSWFLP